MKSVGFGKLSFDFLPTLQNGRPKPWSGLFQAFSPFVSFKLTAKAAEEFILKAVKTLARKIILISSIVILSPEE